MKRHRILDRPVLGYFLLALFVMVVCSVGSHYIDVMFLGEIIPGYLQEVSIGGVTEKTASGAGYALGAVVAAGSFYLWFRPRFDGMLRREGAGRGLLLLVPFLLFHCAGSVVSIFTVGTASVLLAFLRALAPGFGEEVMFRGLGVANWMRTAKSEKGMMAAFWVSSLCFGLIHMTNSLVGAPIWVSVIQAAYAAGIGMAFAAVYLKTGTLWPCIIAHTTVDFLEFIRADLGSTGGIMTGMGIGDWITIAAGVFAGVWALLQMRPKYRKEIMERWSAKWGGETEA